MTNLFTKHPHTINESYLQHFRATCKIAARLSILVFCVLIHGIFPFIFETRTRDSLIQLNQDLLKRNPK